MDLHYKNLGEGPPLIILHGLYGSGDNWLSIAKKLSGKYNVYLVDQRNHGDSPHCPEFNYPVLTQDLHAFVTTNFTEPVSILGHSMGGKVAMNFAIKYPKKLHKLIVVDIALRSYHHPNPKKPYIQHHFHRKIISSLRKLDIDYPETREEVDKALARSISQIEIRQFLLKNLKRNEKGEFCWGLNLEALDDNLDRIMDGITWNNASFTGPVLVIHGEKSEYIQASDYRDFEKAFPGVRIESIHAGHWVHAEQPARLLQLISEFLSE